MNPAAPDTDLEPDQDLTIYNDDKVRLTKYYGLVPKELLEKEDVEVEEDSMYVEAIVVIANGGVLLKAEANPYMMNDRPVVAFPWDVVRDDSGAVASVRRAITARRRLIRA